MAAAAAGTLLLPPEPRANPASGGRSSSTVRSGRKDPSATSASASQTERGTPWPKHW